MPDWAGSLDLRDKTSPLAKRCHSAMAVQPCATVFPSPFPAVSTVSTTSMDIKSQKKTSSFVGPRHPRAGTVDLAVGCPPAVQRGPSGARRGELALFSRSVPGPSPGRSPRSKPAAGAMPPWPARSVHSSLYLGPNAHINWPTKLS